MEHQRATSRKRLGNRTSPEAGPFEDALELESARSHFEPRPDEGDEAHLLDSDLEVPATFDDGTHTWTTRQLNDTDRRKFYEYLGLPKGATAVLLAEARERWPDDLIVMAIWLGL